MASAKKRPVIVPGAEYPTAYYQQYGYKKMADV